MCGLVWCVDLGAWVGVVSGSVVVKIVLIVKTGTTVLIGKLPVRHSPAK